MSWKASNVMDERRDFLRRYRGGERVTDLCREYGISRKTGYKFIERFAEYGEEGLYDKGRRPLRVAGRTAKEVEEAIVAKRKEHPSWGPRKLRQVLIEKTPGVRWPSRATFAAILKRNQLSKPMKRRRGVRPYGRALMHAHAPNDVWCIDYKGQFRLGNGRYCYPLTLTDECSRYIVACEAFESIRWQDVLGTLEQAFKRHGIPRVIRSDNGSPFASSRSALGLSRFTVWLMRRGVVHERIEPSHPEQNGRHERMHRTLKAETARPAKHALLSQQECFDEFQHVFNHKRPHEALGDRVPASVYQPSPRRLPLVLEDPSYPLHDLVRTVLCGGVVHMHSGHRFNLSCALEGELVGLREVDERRWLVTFIEMNLGHYDECSRTFTVLDEDLNLGPKRDLNGPQSSDVLAAE